MSSRVVDGECIKLLLFMHGDGVLGIMRRALGVCDEMCSTLFYGP